QRPLRQVLRAPGEPRRRDRRRMRYHHPLDPKQGCRFHRPLARPPRISTRLTCQSIRRVAETDIDNCAAENPAINKGWGHHVRDGAGDGGRAVLRRGRPRCARERRVPVANALSGRVDPDSPGLADWLAEWVLPYVHEPNLRPVAIAILGHVMLVIGGV